MIISESFENLQIPLPYAQTQLDLGDYTPFRLFLHKGRYLAAEIPDGVKRLWDAKDILFLLRSKHNVTICEPGLFDALLKFLPREAIFRLDLGLSAWVNQVEISYRGTSIKFSDGRNNYYLWNLGGFFRFDNAPDTLEAICAYTDLLTGYFETHSIAYSSLTSPSAIARGLLIQHSFPEFVSRTVDREILEAFYLASHGGRQEVIGIGTVDAWNYDMYKAHLGIISELPSIRGCQYRRNFPYTPDATYGAYSITAQIPRMTLCPLPMEVQNDIGVETVHPYGKISGWYAKPYLDLLSELGIKFQVHESHQYINIGNYKQPFIQPMRLIRQFLNGAPRYLNAKALYYGIAGSTIGWRFHLDENTGELFPQAYPVFSPWIYSHVLATQTARVYREVAKGGQVAIRSDAVTTRKKFSTSLRLDDHGPTTFVTPLFKAFPSERGDEWRGIIDRYRDKSYVEYEVTQYPTIRRFLDRGVPLGKPITSNVRIRPNHGRRIGTKPTRVGDLLTAWIPSIPHPVEHFPLAQ